MKHWPFLALLLLMCVSGLLILAEETDEGVGLDSLLEVWSDVLRDVDQFGLQLTRVSAEEEMRIGQELTGGWWSTGPDASQWQAYVEEVGKLLTPFVYRQDIRYQFHVVRAPCANAYALPGGHVFITTWLLEVMESEAELASVLGHEIAHVDARHCIEKIQYELAMEKVGVGELGRNADFLRRFAALGYSKYQEHEADEQGVRIAIQAGYDPLALLDVMDRVLSEYDPPERSHDEQPLNEFLGVVVDAIRDYGRTHPYSTDRIKRLRRLAERQNSKTSRLELYLGRENFRQRRAKSELYLESELMIPSIED